MISISSSKFCECVRESARKRRVEETYFVRVFEVDAEAEVLEHLTLGFDDLVLGLRVIGVDGHRFYDPANE